MKLFNTQRKLRRIYGVPKDSVYYHKLYDDLSSGYSYIFGIEKGNKDFFSYEPQECDVAELLKEKYQFNFSYYIEKIFNKITYSLIAYGKAYIYIIPEYTIKKENDKSEKKILSSLEIKEIKGFVKNSKNDTIIFCSKGYGETEKEIKMLKKQLIVFDIKDIGYSKMYFSGVVKKLRKNDITSVSTKMVSENVEEYDFSVHLTKGKIKELKATKDMGVFFGTEGLSHSYILYKKIKECKLKMRFLCYFLERFNEGMSVFLGDGTHGYLVAHTINENYDKLWHDYIDGKITGTELTNILYHNN